MSESTAIKELTCHPYSLQTKSVKDTMVVTMEVVITLVDTVMYTMMDIIMVGINFEEDSNSSLLAT